MRSRPASQREVGLLGDCAAQLAGVVHLGIPLQPQVGVGRDVAVQSPEATIGGAAIPEGDQGGQVDLLVRLPPELGRRV